MRTLIFLSVIVASSALAGGPPKSRKEAEAIVSTLKFQEGQVILQKDLATVNVPPGFRFLNGPDANKIIVDLWGNPPQAAEPLGMLMSKPEPLNPDAWAVIITYEGDGYVKDQDAEKIDYNKLLEQMKKAVHEANPERTKAGYPTMELVGWAAPPRYDRETHKLYWAKELKFGGTQEDTLNYNIRVLGRHGVLILNAVASTSQLPEIEKKSPEIVSAIDFNPGNRYADFNPASGDRVAAYGIAALVAGGAAAKLGLFKVLWVAVLAAKKFIIIGAAAVAAWFRKMFGKKKSAGAPDAG
jgi:uncharacterized membrane-anchored protein